MNRFESRGTAAVSASYRTENTCPYPHLFVAMTSKTELVRTTSVILLLLGPVFFSGGHFSSGRECTSGYALVLDRAEGSETATSEENVTNFEDLSPMDQQIFLEAYVDLDDRAGSSDVYAEWPGGRFGMGSYTPLYVDYRGELFETEIHAVDCGLPADELLQSLGVFLGSIGVVLRVGVAITGLPERLAK